MTDSAAAPDSGQRPVGRSRSDREAVFDTGAYADFDMDRFVHRSLSSWDDVRWRALFVQRFDHVTSVDELSLPASASTHLWLVTQGEGGMQTSSGDGWRTTPIVPGALGMAVPGEPTQVRYRTTSPMSTVHIHLPADLLTRTANELGMRAPAPRLTDHTMLGTMVRALTSAAERGLDELYAQTAAEFLAVHLLTQAGATAPALPSREDARVRKAISHMRDRLGEPLALADIAGAAGLSLYHFLRVFKQDTGVTPARYLTRLRVDEAKRLLDRGMTIAEAAQRCGFSSPGHLSTAFLRQTGVRPSTYRFRRG